MVWYRHDGISYTSRLPASGGRPLTGEPRFRNRAAPLVRHAHQVQGNMPRRNIIGNQRSTILMRSSLRRFHSLRSLAQLARFIGRAPDTHAFRQVDVAQAALVASWHALLQSGQILTFDTVGFQTYSENEEDGILLYIFTAAGTTNKVVVE